MSDPAPAAEVLGAAVAAIGGSPRNGQQVMCDQITRSLSDGAHLLIQAGTGTGKSLGYLAPALVWAMESDQTVLVTTATLALQAQLAKKDIPVAARAAAAVLGREPRTEILKGRSNYACLLRVRDQVGGEQETLLGAVEVADAVRSSRAASPESVIGAEVVALREWAEAELVAGGLADRDDAPRHSPRAWAQVSVPVRECLGAAKCPYGEECFVEASRARARQADLVVTNHALLAINAMHGGTALPEHAAVIIDEAHELAARVTGAASSELSPAQIERVAKRASGWLDDELAIELLDVVDGYEAALEEVPPGRITAGDSLAIQAIQLVRQASRRAVSALAAPSDTPDVERTQAAAAMREVFDIAERIARLDEHDVVWLSSNDRFGAQLNVAPLSVAGLMREKVLAEHTTILTSATLTLGGSFDAMAGNVGLKRDDRIDDETEPADDTQWRGLDVGSPFDYPSQGILYVAKGLANPGRDGIAPDALRELAELVWAADGRTLGLFASQRSAELAADHLRNELPELTVLCQGESQLADLTRTFIADERSVLLGTMSLWQGIDVPGDACRLVVIDKIPFPRPDDPLMQARQQAVSKAGGNGFMQVAATHAALLLAQGAGRLIRRDTDRGVVAVLDPRLVRARYGSYLRASLPPFWMTTDLDVVVQALQRLQQGRATA